MGQYREQVIAKPGQQKKPEDQGPWWGRIDCLEMGMTHSLYTADEGLYRSLPRTGVKCTMVCDLKARQVGKSGGEGKTYVNQVYELELVGLEVEGAPPPGRSTR